MSNYTDLKTTLQDKADELDDDAPKYKCLILIDQYIAALEQQATATSTDVSSYSIAGRSVTRGGAANYTSMVADLENQINFLLYGNVTYADFRVNTTDPSTGT